MWSEVTWFTKLPEAFRWKVVRGGEGRERIGSFSLPPLHQKQSPQNDQRMETKTDSDATHDEGWWLLLKLELYAILLLLACNNHSFSYFCVLDSWARAGQPWILEAFFWHKNPYICREVIFPFSQTAAISSAQRKLPLLKRHLFTCITHH